MVIPAPRPCGSAYNGFGSGPSASPSLRTSSSQPAELWVIRCGIGYFSGLESECEFTNSLHALPDGLGAGMTITLAPEKPAKARDQTHHQTQGRWRVWWGASVRDNPGRLPFFGIKHHVARQVGAVPAPGDQMQNPPRDDQVDDQGSFQPLQRAQLQRLNPAARFENSEKNLDQPAAPIPLDQFYHLLQGLRQPVG